jgi:hypothetical protein
MNKSGWIVVSAAVVGFGFGHAGCHTSGIPGGTGAGGTNTGNISASGGRGTSVADAGREAGECQEHADCDDEQLCSMESGTGTCVECLADGDCVFTGKGKVCVADTHSCAACNKDSDCGSSERCALHQCIRTTSCASSALACKNAGAERFCHDSTYCVECEDRGDCQDPLCQGGKCACSDMVCTIDAKRVHQLSADAG